MSITEQKAMERLVTKLSALRKTLRGEERALLDRMVLSTQAEVTTHASKVQAKAAGKTEVALHTANVRAKQADKMHSEVAMHSAKIQGKQAGKTQKMQSEVALHSANIASKNEAMNDSAVSGKLARQQVDSKVAGKAMRIQIDRKSGAYTVVVD